MKGKKLENYLMEHYSFIKVGNDNTKACESGDLTREGIHFQVKGDGGTFANNYHREFTGEIFSDLEKIIQDDYSKFFLLGLQYRSKRFLYWTFTKNQLMKLVRENPDIIWYDRDTESGKPTIRIKVKIKHQLAYNRHCTERIDNPLV